MNNGIVSTSSSSSRRYQLTPIHCRPWLVAYLSVKLIESHYENNYGGALRRLNAITEQLERLDWANTPAHVINGLKREELIALNSTLLHELYFASLGGNGGKPSGPIADALARDFGSVERWQDGFMAMGKLDAGKPVQFIDARPWPAVAREPEVMQGATWRDPERVQEWAGELSKSEPVVVWCSYGFHVGCKTAIALRDLGFDAKFMTGGHSAWKAIDRPTKPCV